MQLFLFSLIMAAALTVLPLPLSAQQANPQQPACPNYMDMMQGQGMGDGMGTGMGMMGMGMGGGPDGDGHGHGMMGGPGMMGGSRSGGMSFFGALKMLDLTQDQQAKINKIELDLRKQLWTLKGSMIDPEAQLEDLYAAERPDAKKIGAVYAKIFDARRQMIETRIEAMNRAREVLNKEQLQKLKQYRQSRPHWRDSD